MDKKMVSVVITTFRRDRNIINRAIQSVLNQSYKNYELIIVDDNGSDNEYRKEVEETIRNINSDRINLICHTENFGAQKARNTGINNAIGYYIAFLDDDDEWDEKKLELQIEKFNQTKVSNIGLVYCWFTQYKELKNQEYSKYIKKTQIKPEEVNSALLYKNFIGSTSVPLIKKECFDKVGFFDESLQAKQDYDMWIRICKKFNSDYVPESLCNYYDHLQERISNNTEKKLNAELNFLEKHFDEISNNRKAFSIRYKTLGTYYLKLGNYKCARKYLWNAIRLSPLSNYKLYILFTMSIIHSKFLKKKLLS